MRIAAVNWQLEPTASVKDFFEHYQRMVALCDGADLIVFPELPCLELLAGKPGMSAAEVPGYLADLLQKEFSSFSPRSKPNPCTIVSGSYFARTDVGIMNTAIVAYPDPKPVITANIPKNVLTQYERTEWKLAPGRGLRKLRDSRVGVTVCYDCEFPESGRALAESGVLVQCVPAFTETAFGFNRVRSSCRARAVENQVIVVHSSLVGSLEREPVPSSCGSSAIITPCTPPFPADGILAETPMDVEAVIMADVDLDALLQTRQSGDVRNWEDRDQGDWTVSEPTCSA